MNILRLCTLARQFMRRTEGAVTVDWVVLTALMMALVAAAFGGMSDAAMSLVEKITGFMNSFLS